VTLTCGVIHFPRPQFVPATAVAGIIWASYAFLIGRLGGKVFEDKEWAGLLLALGLALVVSLIVELVRWLAGRRNTTENGNLMVPMIEIHARRDRTEDT